MLKNFHTHTIRCNHAIGNDEEYVINAINAGYCEIGFSDHAPMLFKNDYYSNYRMTPDLTNDYINSIKSLKEKYKDKIKINVGFEFEYFPELFDETYKYLTECGAEYFILGQHYTDNEYERFAHYSGSMTFDTNILKRYAKQVIDGISTGIYSYVAHPDLINYKGSIKNYNAIMTEMCKELKHLNCPVEANLLGFTDKRNYPNKHFWSIVADVGNEVVIGLDAHSPDVYLDIDERNELIKYINSFGLKINDDIKIKRCSE